MCVTELRAQTPASPANADPWALGLSVSGNFVPNGQTYVSSDLTADRSVLHLEGRYNYEALATGSLWLGYSLSVGKKPDSTDKTLALTVTPMIGGVFGKTNGIAPGLEFTFNFWVLQLYSSDEYVAAVSKADDFFYTWTQLTYSPVAWFTFGVAAQRTRAYETPLSIQRGPLVGFTYKRLNLTAEVFDIGEAATTTVVTLAYSF
jgi:hypothetical protein